MWPAARHALYNLMKPGTDYRLAGLALTALTSATPSLFNGRRAKAIEAMDALIARHGSTVIGLGGVTSEKE
jgi:hypothetical protein